MHSTLDLINSQINVNPMLTTSQWDRIQPAAQIFELIAAGVPDLPNPSMETLIACQCVHVEVFNSALPNLGCQSCRLEMMRRLWPVYMEYKNANQ